MKKPRYFLAISWLFVNSCVTLQPVEFLRADSFAAETNDSIPRLRFNLMFRNPNRFSCTFTDLQTEGLLRGTVLFHAGSEKKIKAHAKSDFTFPVTARLTKQNMSQVLNAGLSLFLSNETIPLQLIGTLRIRKFIFTKRMRFDYTHQLDKTRLNSLF